MKKIFSVLCLVIISIASSAQPLVIEWQNCFGDSRDERAILENGQGYHFDKCLPVVDQTSYKSGNLNSISPENGLTITANPNPANTWVAFDFSLPVIVNGAEILVTDMQGRLVVSFRVAGSEGQRIWDTRSVEKGVYIYTLIAGGTSKQGKLVIQ